MTTATGWWIAAAAAAGLEMVSGTFYLLIISGGLACAALAAHAGLPATAQWVIAGSVGGGICALWHRRLQRHPASPATDRDRNINLDIGERVHVNAWQIPRPGERVVARVHYRGTEWAAAFEGDGTPQAGEFVIRAIQGNTLLLGH